MVKCSEVNVNKHNKIIQLPRVKKYMNASVVSDNNVAGIVILYNPQENVIENINSYINQTNYLFIIDNSEKYDFKLSDFFKAKPNIEYIFNNTNLGIAAALNIGAKKAIEKGYSYLLTMDQDSIAPPNLVKKLCEGLKQFEDVGIISPLHKNKFSNKATGDSYNKILTTMASGNLINLTAYKNVGGFNEDYFIDYVDTEYCLRLNMRGYQLIQCNNVLLLHNEANPYKKNLFLRTIYLYNHSPIRFYYKARNRQYLRRDYKNQFPELFRIEAKLFWRTFLKVILFERNKILKLKMMLLGYIDSLKGKPGRFKKTNN